MPSVFSCGVALYTVGSAYIGSCKDILAWGGITKHFSSTTSTQILLRAVYFLCHRSHISILSIDSIVYIH